MRPTLLPLALLLLAAPLAAEPAPPALPPFDAAARAAALDSLCATIDSVYVFPDVATRMIERVRGRAAAGAYDALATQPDFAQALTADLQDISHDRHLRVTAASPQHVENRAGVSDEERKRQMMAAFARRNFGFEKVERLPGNVGYLDLRGFVDARYAGATAVAAMNLLAHADALIVDVRQNGGGSPSMIQLLGSYLFAAPTHLNSFHVRRDDTTQQFWTQAHVEGTRLDTVPVWVLTSGRTFSAAEEFTYDLKVLGRATIVGETTGGGAHPVTRYAWPSLGLAATVPFGRAVNPVTGTNWEGTGVAPDVATTAAAALETAHRLALDELSRREQDPARRAELSWVADGLRMRAASAALDARALREYAGSYGPRRVRLEGGRLAYQREGGPSYTLIPGGDDTFLLEGLDTFRVRFARDAHGRVAKLVGLYEDGTTDENARDGR